MLTSEARKAPRARSGHRAGQVGSLALLALLAVGGGGFVMWEVEARTVARIGETLAQAAGGLAGEFEDWLRSALHELELQAVVTSTMAEPSSATVTNLALVRRAEYEWLVLLDAGGRVTAAIPQALVGRDESGTGWFRETIGSSKGRAVEAPGPEAAILLVVPRRDARAGFQGAVAALVPLRHLAAKIEARVARGPLRASGPVEYQVLAWDGQLLLDSMLQQSGLVSLNRLQLPSAIAAASGRGGYLEETHLRRHVPVVTGYARVETDLPWLLLLRADRGIIAEAARAEALPVAATAVLLTVAAWVVGARRPRRPPAVDEGGRRFPLPDAPPQEAHGSEGPLTSLSGALSRLIHNLARPTLPTDAGADWARQLIEVLGRALSASRATAVRLRPADDGQVRIERLHEWHAGGGRTEGEHALIGRSLAEVGLSRWQRRLARGEAVWGHVRDLPEPERQRLTAAGVRSVLVLPLFVGLDWWGFLRLDACEAERHWASADREAARAVARLLSAGLELVERAMQRQACLELYAREADGESALALLDAEDRVVGFTPRFAQLWQLPEPVAASQDPSQTLAHVLSRVKTPSLFLRAMTEFPPAADVESYDLVELLDGRVVERSAQRAPLPGGGVGRLWRFVDCDEAEPSRTTAEPRAGRPEATREGRALRLEAVREQERQRLAREIHDQLGQSLTNLKLDLAQLSGQTSHDAERLQARLQTMSEMVSRTLHIVRRIATELRPAILDDLGLPAALEWQVREFESRTGIPCTVTISPDAEQLALEPLRATALFRILQEALTNVARHAQASAVHVRLMGQQGDAGDRRLVLEVQDNGRGIAEGVIEHPQALGVAGMRERAAMLQGRLHVRRAARTGTIVTVDIPMETDHD